MKLNPDTNPPGGGSWLWDPEAEAWVPNTAHDGTPKAEPEQIAEQAQDLPAPDSLDPQQPE
jgi:hypothetical protein